MASLSEFPVYAVLAASDLDRARAWYRDKLGFTPKVEEGGLWFECARGTWLLVYPTAHAGTAQNTQASFHVEDVRAVVDDLRARGVTFEEYDFGEMGKTEDGIFTMGNAKAAWFKDSEGNTIEVAQVG